MRAGTLCICVMALWILLQFIYIMSRDDCASCAAADKSPVELLGGVHHNQSIKSLRDTISMLQRQIDLQSRQVTHLQAELSSGRGDSRQELAERRSATRNCSDCVLGQSINQLKDACVISVDQSVPVIYVITPTYKRHVQKAELTRLSHTLRLVPNLHWLVVEDAPQKSPLVSRLLERSCVSSTHLFIPTPSHMKLTATDKPWDKPRGVWQRNEGLDWLVRHLQENAAKATNQAIAQTTVPDTATSSNQPPDGLLYFADDDNTYSLDLFDEIRSVRTVGVWPVAFVGELLVEKPIVVNGKVRGWDVGYKPDRPFAMDMAGFAVNLRLLSAYPEARFAANQSVGYQETYFLQGLRVALTDLEPKAQNCSKVSVWHTRTMPVNLATEKRWNKRGKFSTGDLEY